MDEHDGRRLNVKFRESDQTEREAARIMSKVPVRGRSHYIAEAVVAFETACMLDGCNNATIEQIATLVVSKLMGAGMNPAKTHQSDPNAPKKKRGRPPKNKVPALPSVTVDISAEAPAPANKRSQDAAPKFLESVQEKQVDEDMVNSMMSLISF